MRAGSICFLVGGRAENTEIVLDTYLAANRSPKMKEVYRKHLDDWKSAGGTIYNHYKHVDPAEKKGMWGEKEYQNQTRASAPKYDAILTWIENNLGL